jgi:hypothetical protein
VNRDWQRRAAALAAGHRPTSREHDASPPPAPRAGGPDGTPAVATLALAQTGNRTRAAAVKWIVNPTVFRDSLTRNLHQPACVTVVAAVEGRDKTLTAL